MGNVLMVGFTLGIFMVCYPLTTQADDGDNSVSPSLEKNVDEGDVRGRSHFPEHPELYLPMPLPDKSKRQSTPIKGDPEKPVTQNLEDENVKCKKIE